LSETIDPGATPDPSESPRVADPAGSAPPPATDAPAVATAPPFPAQPASPTGPQDMWVRPPAGEGAGGSGATEGPPGPWAFPAPQPWDGTGRWTPGPWGGPPIWLPPRPTPRNRPLHVIGLTAGVLLVAVLGVAIGRQSIQNGVGGPSPLGTSTPSSPGLAGASDTGTIQTKVDPGVVDIATQLGFQGGEAAGTGMVLNASGDVLTNNHVIDGATSISVTDVGDGQTYNATVVGTDKTDDIAVVRLVGASGLDTVVMGNSSTLAIGAPVTAVGNAGGRGGTPSVATGHVTELDQAITASDESDNSHEQLTGLVQTDAALQPGDSGGPLVNSAGAVVGMDTAASSAYQFEAGTQGFAIPINHAEAIARQILAGQSSGTVHIGEAALIGVIVQDASQIPGAEVVSVETGTPADSAGVVPFDVITSLGGRTVDSAQSLTDLMQRHHPGQKLQLGWIDTSGLQHTSTVQLAIGPAT